MLNAPGLTLECVIKASRGFRSGISAKGAGFNSWRGENCAQEERFVLITKGGRNPLYFFGFIFWETLTQTEQMSVVRTEDDRALGPIGLDYGITGLIVGQSSGKSRSRATDALEWRLHKRLDGINGSVSCFYPTLWRGEAVHATRAEPVCNSVPHRKKKVHASRAATADNAAFWTGMSVRAVA